MVLLPLFDLKDLSGIHLMNATRLTKPQVCECLDSKRRAFTLIELLVSIVVLSVLIALLLPAVQQSREAARMVSCKNNLKQLALSVHSFHETFGYVPPAAVSEHKMTWAWFTLPFIEQDSLFQQWKTGENFYVQNSAVLRTVVATHLCPSRTRGTTISRITSDRSFFYPTLGGINVKVEAAEGDYLGVGGSKYLGQIRGIHDNVSYSSWDGMFTFARNWGGYPRIIPRVLKDWKPVVRFASVTDGLSNTLMLGEIDSSISEFHCIRNGDFGGVSFLGPSRRFESAGGFSSNHHNIVNFAMADGSVRSISGNVSIDVAKNLTTRAGGEVIGEF
jgi:prepilin-type N-terminal cleavage/methylation domain-containing protein